MNRQEIIETAKNNLPRFEDNIQHKIRIRVQDGTDSYEVEFERCYVDSKRIVRNDWSLMPHEFKLAWIPSEYFEYFTIGGVVNVQQAINEKLLSEYLIKDNQ